MMFCSYFLSYALLRRWPLLLVVSTIFSIACSSPKHAPLQITVTECVDGITVREYDLTKQTMRVRNNLKPNTTIHFTLTAAEKEDIVNKYYDLGIELVTTQSTLERDCLIIPMPCQRLRVVSGALTQELSMRTSCEGYTADGKKVKAFLNTVMRTLEAKAELEQARDSDMLFM